MELKEQCLDQTLRILSDKGLKFTMSELATQLGMSKKTIYLLFKSKEELLSEVVRHSFAKIKEAERAILEDNSLDLLEKIKSLTIVLPDVYKTLNWNRMTELAEKYPKIYHQVQEAIESDWETTLALYEEAISTGLMKKTNLIIVKGMVEASIEHFLTSKKLSDNQVSYVEALDTMMDILLFGLVTSEAKTKRRI